MDGIFWGESQTFFQLAIGLNAGLSLANFFGRKAAEEKKLLADMLQDLAVRLVEQKDQMDKRPGIPIELSIRSLINLCAKIGRDSDNFESHVLRISCIIGCVLGFIGLALSVIYFREHIGIFGFLLILGSNVPFFVGLYWALKLSWKIRSKVTAQRRELEKLLYETGEDGQCLW